MHGTGSGRRGSRGSSMVIRHGRGWAIAISLLVSGIGQAAEHEQPFLHSVQIPYNRPPLPEAGPNTTVPPNTEPLSPEEVKRAEALLPLLSGNQEFWAMGQFVHLGAPVTPILVKALTMPDPRLRYNAIETMKMIKDPSVAPALVKSAIEPLEMPRVRAHALRTAVRLNPAVTPQAIEAMAKDSHDSIRKAAAFEARHVRENAVIPVLIGLIQDEEMYVAITAFDSLMRLTRHNTEMHDWQMSTQKDRKEWAKEWISWWEVSEDTFEIPPPPRRRRRLQFP